VLKVSREVQDGEEREVDVLNPSMYFAVEKAGLASCGVNNIYLNGVRVAGMLADGETRYYHTDQVDSVKAVTDDAGMVQSRMEYLPFGETWFQEDGSTFEGFNLPKYNSQELDRETGYYFYNARHYDPEIGRFVTADTVIDGELSTQGWNRFAYVHNNPIRYKDPTGHWGISLNGGGHETITRVAIQYLNKQEGSNYKYTDDLDEGISYPDVPDGNMNSTYPNILGEELNIKSLVANQSHKGEKQYWHGMSNGKWKNSEVVDKIVSQAKEWYNDGQKAKGTKMEDRYLGALQHMIQDTRCPSHTQRNERREIIKFQEYDKQIEDNVDHAKYDSLWQNRDKNILQKGIKESVIDTMTIYKALKNGDDFKTVEKYLRNEVLRIEKGRENEVSKGYDVNLDKK
jgi:RHS repeat-associated protein